MTTVPGGSNILIVDDDIHVAETLESIFLSRGYRVQVANSAEEAIEAIAGWRPDLALVDVMLPRMNGIEFGEVLRSNHPSCLLVLVSGHPCTSELLESARRDGQPPMQILAKPLHPTHILEILAGLLPGVAGEA